MATVPEMRAISPAADPDVYSYAAPGVPRARRLPKPTFFQSVRLRSGDWLITVLNLGTFFAVWEYVARQEVLPAIFFPRPSMMFLELYQMATNGQLWYHLQFSMVNLVVGVLIGASVGITLGLAAGTFPRFYAIIAPYYWALYATPNLAIYPLLVMWGGFGPQVKITLVFLSAVMPILINTITGVSTVDPVLMRVGRVLNGSRLQLYTKIVIPYTLPFILTGMTQGVSRGLVAMVTSEMLGSGRGIGYAIVRSVEAFNPARAFALLFTLIIMAMLAVNGMELLSERATPWRKQLRL